MDTKTQKLWYVGRTGNHQGLVIDEATGTSIAVAYDKADAPLLASAPELLEMLSAIVSLHDDGETISKLTWNEARNLIATATGRE